MAGAGVEGLESALVTAAWWHRRPDHRYTCVTRETILERPLLMTQRPPVRISTDETIREIRLALSREFATTEFHIVAGSARRLKWVTISWSSGPSVRAVYDITEQFAGLRFQPNGSRRRRRRYITALDENGQRFRKTYEPGIVALHRLPNRS